MCAKGGRTARTTGVDKEVRQLAEIDGLVERLQLWPLADMDRRIQEEREEKAAAAAAPPLPPQLTLPPLCPWRSRTSTL